jgi:hypothetical protein
MMEINYDKSYVFAPFALVNPEINGYNTRAKSQEPRAKSQEPRAKSQEPRAKSQEPRAKAIAIF